MDSTFIKRGRLEIIYQILLLCVKPSRKTNILYKCNLNHEQLDKYLEYLRSFDLLESFTNTRIEYYQITEKGKKFKGDFERLNSHLEPRTDAPVVSRRGQGKNTLEGSKTSGIFSTYAFGGRFPKQSYGRLV